MKETILLGVLAMVVAGCNNSPQLVANSNTNANVAVNTKKSDSLSVTSHSTEKTAPPATSSPSSSTGSPNAAAIDVSAMTEKIEKAEKEHKAKPADVKAKEALAAAYFERATALTQAAQYRAALGDYRKGLKLNPNEESAKSMHDQIISIFESIGREPPKEGEEPTPLPFKK